MFAYAIGELLHALFADVAYPGGAMCGQSGRLVDGGIEQAPGGGTKGESQPMESSRIDRRRVLAPTFPMHRGKKIMKTSKNLLPTFDIGSHSNAGLHGLRTSVASEQSRASQL